MRIKIITDSTADLPINLVGDLGITVVPVYVRFGNEVFRDGVDITQEEVYRRLLAGEVPPATSQPPPADFAAYYREALKNYDEVISIHLSSKLSGTFNSALSGRDLLPEKARITVLDSLSLSMGLGLAAVTAARLCLAGASKEAIVESVKQTAPLTRIIAMFDTLKYAFRSGRLGAAKSLIGGILNVKPLLTLRDGSFWPVGIARTRVRAFDTMVDLVRKTPDIADVAVVYATTPDEAETLKERLSAFVEKTRIHISRLGPALGAHGGPGIMAVFIRQQPAALPLA
ncbi:DegV family protein [Dehalogenimonas alkenigignens]|uniref:EDD domain protein, DegV family n=1 Tax=Dehalogenimonas alkenigignens TaxID=1217799 RepID=A0A0W0GK83_9CHLR|nr:DegV family protein [Dehalogenimonas alkenigignens]KTB48930.1 EDD domain protein, DegV family [Dehalogenimonas alkenigignens]PVV82744.1 DegV family protein [Dehalogenimonas alkenigignens]